MLPPNVNKSPFKAGTYAVYDGRGYVWLATKSGDPKNRWVARPAPNNPALSHVRIHEHTLAAVAGVLTARVPAPQVEWVL